jgi:hypothetical protein
VRRAVLSLLFVASATGATAQTTPEELREFQQLTVQRDLTPLERRTLAIVREELRRQRSTGELDIDIPPAVLDTAPVELPGVEMYVTPEASLALTNGTATDAVQDPCLLSADPSCHEKHALDYHPYLGYIPPSPP